MAAMIARMRLRGSTGNSSLIAGGTLLFVSTTLVNAGNYLFNLILGRWLGPADFADLSLIVTLLLVFSFASTTLGLVAARFAAVSEAEGNIDEIATLRGWLVQRAWVIGIIVMSLLVFGSSFLRSFFKAESAWPFIILGIGIPLFFVQGVDRGILQGRTRFLRLAASYQAEMWTRLLGGILLVAIGLSINGAVGAIALSFLATWWVARNVAVGLPPAGRLSSEQRQRILLFSRPVIAGLIGQILINNSDVLVIKHFFPATDAGQYAALALVGRIVFFATWSIVTVTFPVVAQKHERGESHIHLLWISVGIVLTISGGLAVIMAAAPELVVRMLFGGEYLPIAPLLWMYALSTGLFALANVAINYLLSTGNGIGSLFAFLAGIAQVIGLWFFHDTLKTAVIVQIIIMATLACTVFVWILIQQLQATSQRSTNHA